MQRAQFAFHVSASIDLIFTRAMDVVESIKPVICTVLNCGLSLFLGPTHGIEDFVSKPGHNEDLQFVVPLGKVVVFLAHVFERLAKRCVVSDVSIIGSRFGPRCNP